MHGSPYNYLLPEALDRVRGRAIAGMLAVLMILAAFLVFSAPGDAGAQPRDGRWAVTRSGVVDMGGGIQISALSVARP